MDRIPQDMLIKIYEQAKREYPAECCGMILGPRNRKTVLSRLRVCENAQDRFHDLDPEVFPRTSATAYFIDPKELLAIEKECAEKNEEIRIVYHSHIDTGAHFSEEDKRVAVMEGEPALPGVDYLVVSVVKGEIMDTRIYRWDDVKKDFVL